MNFKEKWNQVDEVCPHCKQITKRNRGITRQNIKRLLIPKFNMNELLITIILLMVIMLGLLYSTETKACRDWIAPMINGTKDSCKDICDYKCEMFHTLDNQNLNNFNLSSFSVTNLTKT